MYPCVKSNHLVTKSQYPTNVRLNSCLEKKNNKKIEKEYKGQLKLGNS